jgi:hypothetical protein
MLGIWEAEVGAQEFYAEATSWEGKKALDEADWERVKAAIVDTAEVD